MGALLLLASLLAAPAATGPSSAGAVEHTRLLALLRSIDERQRSTGDWRSVVFIQQKERGKVDVVYETISMRRSASRRTDFDESRLGEEYEPTDLGQEKLGVHTTRVMRLEARPGLDVAFPVMKLRVDEASGNLLKRQEFALSGRLLRTTYYPAWKKIYSRSKKADVWYAPEIRLYDELEKENSTLILVKSVDPSPLEANIFTKAWLESRSR